MTLPKLEPLPFLEALAFWSTKTQLGPKAFSALSDRAKVLAFGVARIAQGQELNTVYTLLGKALQDGTTFKDFQAGAGDIFTRRGWAGNQAWKVDSIFRTNIQSAYNAGQYQALKRNMDTMPYWMYSAIGDNRTRPSHAAMSGRVWPADHPIWDTWFPPNGFRCRCSVHGVTEDQVQDRGMVIESQNPTGQQVQLPEKGGEPQGIVILQPDKGFATNPGQVWTKTFGTYAQETIAGFPALLQQAVMTEMITSDDKAILLSGGQIDQDTF